MFTPNLLGSLRRVDGRDIHGRHQLSPPISCPFAIVDLKVGAVKTSVRADSSASRGSANETVVERGKILVPSSISIKNGDVFSYANVKYEVVSTHGRHSVCGRLDHWEIDIEAFVG